MHFRIHLDRFDCSRHARVVAIKSLANLHVGPVVRIELEAIVIVPIVRVVLVMSVVFPYDEQATQVAFDYSE